MEEFFKALQKLEDLPLFQTGQASMMEKLNRAFIAINEILAAARRVDLKQLALLKGMERRMFLIVENGLTGAYHVPAQKIEDPQA